MPGQPGRPAALQGLSGRFLPEPAFRSRQNHKLQYAELAAVPCRAGPKRLAE
jgi:hypothetical protein